MPLAISIILLVAVNPEAGTTGFNFLRVTPTAREAAMGNATAGLGNDAFGLWYNPAGLSGVRSRQLGLSYVSYVAGVQSGTVAYVAPSDKFTWGAGGYYLNSGFMKLTSDNPAPNEDLGSFSCSYLALGAAGSMRLVDELAAGMNLKILYGGIYTYWTLGLAGDVGISYKLPVDGLKAGIAGRNIGLTIKPFGGDTFLVVRDRLPTELALGISYAPATPFLLSLEMVKPVDNSLEARLGIEGWLHRYFCLRGGITTRGGELKAGSGWDFAAGLSTGIGVRFRQFELDYAFTPMVILDNAHRLSFRWNL